MGDSNRRGTLNPEKKETYRLPFLLNFVSSRQNFSTLGAIRLPEHTLTRSSKLHLKISWDLLPLVLDEKLALLLFSKRPLLRNLPFKTTYVNPVELLGVMISKVCDFVVVSYCRETCFVLSLFPVLRHL